MKKTYISPKVKCIELMFEGLIADSNGDGGLGDGDSPVDGVAGGDQENNFSNRRSIWGNTEW